MFARYVSAISTGTLMTLGLIYIMQVLIGLDPLKVVEPPRLGTLDFVRLVRDTPTHTEEFEPPPLEELTAVDPAPPRPDFEGDKIATGVRMPGQQTPTGSGTLPDINTLSDGPAISVIQVQPVYPHTALARELEGFVDVEFDVLEDGSVANARVVQSTSSLFHRSALQAAAKMKFKPRVVDGVPLVSRGLRNRFTYRLDD